MLKNLLLICFFICFIAKSHGQIFVRLDDDKNYLELLENRLKEGKTDSIKTMTAFRLSYFYKKYQNMPLAKEKLDLGVKLAKGNTFLEGAANYYQAYHELGATDLASIEMKLKTSDSLLQTLNFPEAKKTRSSVWVMLGVLKQLSGNEKAGLEAYINHALPLAVESKDLFTEANARKFIGTSLLNARERNKANEYFKAALKLFEDAPSESDVTKMEGILEVTLLLAENNIFLNNLQAGKMYLDAAYAVLKNHPNSNVFLFYYFPEGFYYQKKKDYKRALESFDKAIAYKGFGTDNFYINRSKFAKFHVLSELGRNNEAITVMQDLLKSINLLPSDRNSYSNLLAQTYAKVGNMKAAYEWSQKYITVNDSLHEIGYKKDLLDLETKYKTAEKEKEITQLQAEKQASVLVQKNQRLWVWLLAVGAVVFLLAFLYLNNILKNQKRESAFKLKEMEQEKELQVTKAFLEGEDKERQRIAQDLHDGLGGALAGIKMKLSGVQSQMQVNEIDNSVEQLDKSIVELRRIAHNMMPTNLLRSGLTVALRDLCSALSNPKINIELQTEGLDKNLNQQEQINIYRIVQELLSNALRHSGASHVLVQCLQNENHMLITVEDNGKGFDLRKVQLSKGMGLRNIENRVNLMKGTLDYDVIPGEGTIVNIELNV